MKIKYSILLIAALLCGFVSGCTTGTNNIAVKTEAGLIPSVNVAMSLWAARVKAGKATQAQVDRIHTLYDAYFNGQLKLKAALEKSIASKLPADEVTATVAIAEAKASETQLLNTVNPLIK